MIFIILGSQKFQFNRLLKSVDQLCENGSITQEVFAQIGYSDYKPLNYQYKAFIDREEFAKTIAKADIVITHGGTGAIINAVKQRKKVIAVPRLAEFGEHVDDHQLQIIEQFDEMNYICSCTDTDKLADSIDYVNKHQFNKYKSNTDAIIQSIESYLDGLE